MVGSSGKVLAFEPNPRTFGFLRRNISAYENVVLFQVAVADKEGTVEFFDEQVESGGASLRHHDEERRLVF